MKDNSVELNYRLAMRVEGPFWVAYLAPRDTMKDAVPLGSIRMTGVEGEQNLPRKTAFISLMRDMLTDLVEELTGERPVWSGLQRAPEHERAGKA